MSGDDDTRCKENVAGGGGDSGAELEKKNLPKPSIVRKRSYSFSDGKLLLQCLACPSWHKVPQLIFTSSKARLKSILSVSSYSRFFF